MDKNNFSRNNVINGIFFAQKFDPLLCNRIYSWARRWPSKSVWCSTYVIEMVNDIICDDITRIYMAIRTINRLCNNSALCNYSSHSMAYYYVLNFSFRRNSAIRIFSLWFFALFSHSLRFLSLHFSNVHFNRKNSEHHKNMMMDH